MKELVTEQLRQLSESLGLLQRRVRAAVAGEVSRAVSDAVAQVLEKSLDCPKAAARRPAWEKEEWYDPYGPPDWPEPGTGDWREYVQPQQRGGYREESAMGAKETEGGASVPAALALALSTGRWWLGRRGSPWAAAGVGLLVGGAMLAGGPLVRTALGAIWAVDRLLSTTEAIGDGARLLARRTDEE